MSVCFFSSAQSRTNFCTDMVFPMPASPFVRTVLMFSPSKILLHIISLSSAVQRNGFSLMLHSINMSFSSCLSPLNVPSFRYMSFSVILCLNVFRWHADTIKTQQFSTTSLVFSYDVSLILSILNIDVVGIKEFMKCTEHLNEKSHLLKVILSIKCQTISLFLHVSRKR